MPATWSPETAMQLARSAGLGTLGGHHWKVIACAREEAARCGRAPSLQRIATLTGFGPGELHRLFPGRTASLIAALAGYAPLPPGTTRNAARRH
ncbi:MAG: TusE/DsrC/DsvC family sulfur relay protein [Candidatus Eisenbacteria bacterium]